MLHIVTLPLGSYQTNCYIVWAEDASSCAVIDPGYEAEYILKKIAGLGLTCEAILLTHGHFDHVGAVEALVKATGCALWMHPGDHDLNVDATTGFFYPLAGCENANLWRDGEEISVGGLRFTVLETPGHTRGSVCYRCEDALFSGDTLFAGSCGRIDLPGGDRMAMIDSLEQLAQLTEDLRIFPGHGPASTLSREQESNPYLQNS